MKVYRLIPDGNTYQYGLPESDADRALLDLDGTSRKADWTPPRLYIYQPRLKRGDFFHFGAMGPICSAQAVNVLQRFFEEAGELLPVIVDEIQLTLVNVTTVAECLDEEKSICDFYEDENGKRRPYSIEKYVFDPARLPESALFRLAGGDVRAYDYVHEGRRAPEKEFRHVVEAAGLKGLLFEEMWNDEPPVQVSEG